MFEIKTTGTQTLEQAIDQMKANGYYVATTVETVDGKEIPVSAYALTLDEYMLSIGIKSVEAQDKVLADLMSQMGKQTANLTDINDCLQMLNNMKAGFESSPTDGSQRTASLSQEQKQYVEYAISTVNDWISENPSAGLTALGTLPDPAVVADMVPLFATMQALLGSNKLPAVFDGMLAHASMILHDNSIQQEFCQVTGDLWAKLESLSKEGLLQLGGITKGTNLTLEQLETLQKNLSTAQSSQGALNEDISLRLNEAASKRSAIFTQLQTLLQTIMQTRSALARW